MTLITRVNWRRGVLKNIAANIELQDLLKNLDVKIIIDVGSNKGQFILLVENFFNCQKIYSIEPIKEVLEIQKKFFKNKKNIFYYNCGLGEKKSINNFFITRRIDSSSFLQTNKAILLNNDYKIKDQRKIKINTLDELMKNKNFNSPTLLKIDVQGYELKVLKGAIKTLKKIKYIIIETSKTEIYANQALHKNVINFLEKNNFKIIRENKSTKIRNTNYKQKDLLLKNNLLK